MSVLDSSFNSPVSLKGSSTSGPGVSIFVMVTLTWPFSPSVFIARLFLKSSERALATLLALTAICFENACKADTLLCIGEIINITPKKVSLKEFVAITVLKRY